MYRLFIEVLLHLKIVEIVILAKRVDIADKIAVISVKTFYESKYFLVTRILRYTILSTSGHNTLSEFNS